MKWWPCAKHAAESQSVTDYSLALAILWLHVRWCFLMFIIIFHKTSNLFIFQLISPRHYRARLLLYNIFDFTTKTWWSGSFSGGSVWNKFQRKVAILKVSQNARKSVGGVVRFLYSCRIPPRSCYNCFFIVKVSWELCELLNHASY